MKTAKIVFIILGWLFIFLQLVSYIGALGQGQPVFPRTDIAYLIGQNLFLLVGILFLFLAWRKKIKIKESAGARELETLFSEPNEEKVD